MALRTTKEIGDFYEKLACKHYETQGHNILERNYRYKNSEIDIISALLRGFIKQISFLSPYVKVLWYYCQLMHSKKYVSREGGFTSCKCHMFSQSPLH